MLPDQLFAAGPDLNLHYGGSSADIQAFRPQLGSPRSTAPDSLFYAAPWLSPDVPKLMIDENLTDDPCSSLWMAPTVNGSEFPTFVSNGEQPTIIETSPQGHQYLRPSEVSGYCDPANLRESPKYQQVTNQSSNVFSDARCDCIVCTNVGGHPHTTYGHGYRCRFTDCGKTTATFDFLEKHEKRHFLHEGGYKCNASNCTRSCKRFTDLTRHVTSVHCKNPQKFPCPMFWCRHSGENGFTRKDKMKSHYKEVHEGNRKVNPNVSRGVPRAILPATGGGPPHMEPNGPAHEYGVGERENKRVRRS